MHTFQINNITFEARTEYGDVSLRRLYDNGYDEYQIYCPGTGRWDRPRIEYDIFRVTGDGIREKVKSAFYVADPDDLPTLWNADVFYRNIVFRFINGLLEVLPQFGGSSFKDGYHCYSQAGQPQQPVVYDWSKTDSSYTLDADGITQIDQNTGTVTVDTPTNGTAPFEYSLVPKGQPRSFGTAQSWTGLAAGEYELAVRDSQQVPTLDDQGNVIVTGVTQVRRVFVGQGNDVTV